MRTLHDEKGGNMYRAAGWFSVILSAALIAPLIHAQNSQTSNGGGASLSAGAEYSSFNPDYGCPNNIAFYCGGSEGNKLLQGVGAFVDLNLHPKWGAEGEARWLRWNGPGSEVESTYLVGGRYRMARFEKFDLWGKMLVGDGSITSAGYSTGHGVQGNYLVYAPGATLDYRLTSHLSLRADYEYQIWPSFDGVPTSTGVHNHGLSPNGISIGFSWKFRGW